MADKKNYYAVKKGRIPGIYKTWAECKAQVDGFSGATYKGFKTLAEAEQYMSIESSGGAEADSSSMKALRGSSGRSRFVNPVKSSVQFDAEDVRFYMESLRESEAVAFVDGSYNITTKVYTTRRPIRWDRARP